MSWSEDLRNVQGADAYRADPGRYPRTCSSGSGTLQLEKSADRVMFTQISIERMITI